MMPILLCGHPKSGTTLLLSLLDGSPELCVFPGEARFFTLAMPRLARDPQAGIRFFVDRAFEDALFGTSEKAPIPVDRLTYQAALTERWASEGYSLPTFLPVAMEVYAELNRQSNRRYWVEKTPLTELHYKLVARWYPNARIIYCIRDPRATFSAMRTWTARQGRPLNVGRFAHAWRRSVRAAEGAQALIPTLIVRYEDLVFSTSEAVGRICKFLDIEENASLFRTTLGGSPYHGNSIYGRKFEGVDRAAANRWRQILRPDEVSSIESLLYPYMSRFGYPADAATRSRMHRIRTMRALALMTLHDLFNGLPEPIKRTYRRVVHGISVD